MVSIGLVSNTANSIKLRATGLGSATYNEIQLKMNNQSRQLTKQTGGVSSTGEWTSLSANSAYPVTSYIMTTGWGLSQPTATVYTLPNKPSMWLNEHTDTGFKVNWSEPSGGASGGYRLAVRQGNNYTGTLVKEYSVSSSVTTRTVTGLTAGTQYFVGLVAKNAIGQESINDQIVTTTRPSRTTSASIESVTSTGVYLTWTSGVGASSYEVEVYDSYGVLVKEVSASNTYLTISQLDPSMKYELRIHSVSNGAYSHNYYSTTFTTLPATPSNITVDKYSTSLKFKWTNSSSVTHYYYSLYDSSNNLISSGSTTSNNKEFTGLSTNKTYQFYVYGYNSSTYKYSPTVGGTATTTNPPPSAPILTGTSSTDTTFAVSWGAVSGATGYRIVIESDSESGAQTYSATVTGTSKTFTGLPSNAGFFGYMVAYNSGGDSSSTVVAGYTRPSSATVSSSNVKANTATINFTSTLKNKESYVYELYRGTSASGTLVISSTSTSLSYANLTGLSAGTNYFLRVRKYSSKSSLYSSSYASTSFVTTATPPSKPTINSIARTSGTELKLGFSTVTGATSYKVEVYRNSDNEYITTATGTSSPILVSGLSEYTAYTLYLSASNSGGSSGLSSISGTTRDVTPPTLSITATYVNGEMRVSYSASDSGSGLKGTSKYLLSITGNGNTTYKAKSYTDNNYYTFTSDGAGNAFVNNGKYYIKVTAYDKDGNTKDAVTSQLTFKSARPPNWTWWTTKVAGGSIDIKADEWNSLCIRINQFRQYKNLSAYSFTTIKKGDIISYWVFNQARNAIASMSTSGLSSTVAQGESIKASHFNSLTTVLNSIT